MRTGTSLIRNSRNRKISQNSVICDICDISVISQNITGYHRNFTAVIFLWYVVIPRRGNSRNRKFCDHFKITSCLAVRHRWHISITNPGQLRTGLSISAHPLSELAANSNRLRNSCAVQHNSHHLPLTTWVFKFSTWNLEFYENCCRSWQCFPPPNQLVNLSIYLHMTYRS